MSEGELKEWTFCKVHEIVVKHGTCHFCHGDRNLIQVAQTTDSESWIDAKDEWSDAIHAAHPTRSDSHEQYAIAMRMVSNRYSKGAIVALINWLLVRIAKLERALLMVENGGADGISEAGCTWCHTHPFEGENHARPKPHVTSLGCPVADALQGVPRDLDGTKTERWRCVVIGGCGQRFVPHSRIAEVVNAGLELEAAYEHAQNMFHNYNDWTSEEWDRIQAARNKLCAFSSEPPKVKR